MGLSIIVDIDGTLSNPNHRRHLVEGENNDWEQFFASCHMDELNGWAYELCRKFSEDYEVILVTARPEVSKDGVLVKELTKEWLRKHSVPYHKLLMRQEGDFRKDTVVKQEILDERLKDKNILMAIDDRNDIAEMWRENGITCLQCKDEVEK